MSRPNQQKFDTAKTLPGAIIKDEIIKSRGGRRDNGSIADKVVCSDVAFFNPVSRDYYIIRKQTTSNSGNGKNDSSYSYVKVPESGYKSYRYTGEQCFTMAEESNEENFLAAQENSRKAQELWQKHAQSGNIYALMLSSNPVKHKCIFSQALDPETGQYVKIAFFNNGEIRILKPDFDIHKKSSPSDNNGHYGPLVTDQARYDNLFAQIKNIVIDPSQIMTHPLPTTMAGSAASGQTISTAAAGATFSAPASAAVAPTMTAAAAASAMTASAAAAAANPYMPRVSAIFADLAANQHADSFQADENGTILTLYLATGPYTNMGYHLGSDGVIYKDSTASEVAMGKIKLKNGSYLAMLTRDEFPRGVDFAGLLAAFETHKDVILGGVAPAPAATAAAPSFAASAAAPAPAASASSTATAVDYTPQIRALYEESDSKTYNNGRRNIDGDGKVTIANDGKFYRFETSPTYYISEDSIWKFIRYDEATKTNITQKLENNEISQAIAAIKQYRTENKRQLDVIKTLRQDTSQVLDVLPGGSATSKTRNDLAISVKEVEKINTYIFTANISGAKQTIGMFSNGFFIITADNKTGNRVIKADEFDQCVIAARAAIADTQTKIASERAAAAATLAPTSTAAPAPASSASSVAASGSTAPAPAAQAQPQPSSAGTSSSGAAGSGAGGSAGAGVNPNPAASAEQQELAALYTELTQYITQENLSPPAFKIENNSVFILSNDAWLKITKNGANYDISFINVADDKPLADDNPRNPYKTLQQKIVGARDIFGQRKRFIQRLKDLNLSHFNFDFPIAGRTVNFTIDDNGYEIYYLHGQERIKIGPRVENLEKILTTIKQTYIKGFCQHFENNFSVIGKNANNSYEITCDPYNNGTNFKFIISANRITFFVDNNPHEYDLINANDQDIKLFIRKISEKTNEIKVSIPLPKPSGLNLGHNLGSSSNTDDASLLPPPPASLLAQNAFDLDPFANLQPLPPAPPAGAFPQPDVTRDDSLEVEPAPAAARTAAVVVVDANLKTKFTEITTQPADGISEIDLFRIMATNLGQNFSNIPVGSDFFRIENEIIKKIGSDRTVTIATTQDKKALLGEFERLNTARTDEQRREAARLAAEENARRAAEEETRRRAEEEQIALAEQERQRREAEADRVRREAEAERQRRIADAETARLAALVAAREAAANAVRIAAEEAAAKVVKKEVVNFLLELCTNLEITLTPTIIAIDPNDGTVDFDTAHIRQVLTALQTFNRDDITDKSLLADGEILPTTQKELVTALQNKAVIALYQISRSTKTPRSSDINQNIIQDHRQEIELEADGGIKVATILVADSTDKLDAIKRAKTKIIDQRFALKNVTDEIIKDEYKILYDQPRANEFEFGHNGTNYKIVNNVLKKADDSYPTLEEAEEIFAELLTRKNIVLRKIAAFHQTIGVANDGTIATQRGNIGGDTKFLANTAGDYYSLEINPGPTAKTFYIKNNEVREKQADDTTKILTGTELTARAAEVTAFLNNGDRLLKTQIRALHAELLQNHSLNAEQNIGGNNVLLAFLGGNPAFIGIDPTTQTIVRANYNDPNWEIAITAETQQDLYNSLRAIADQQNRVVADIKALYDEIQRDHNQFIVTNEFIFYKKIGTEDYKFKINADGDIHRVDGTGNEVVYWRDVANHTQILADARKAYAERKELKTIFEELQRKATNGFPHHKDHSADLTSGATPCFSIDDIAVRFDQATGIYEFGTIVAAAPTAGAAGAGAAPAQFDFHPQEDADFNAFKTSRQNRERREDDLRRQISDFYSTLQGAPLNDTKGNYHIHNNKKIYQDGRIFIQGATDTAAEIADYNAVIAFANTERLRVLKTTQGAEIANLIATWQNNHNAAANPLNINVGTTDGFIRINDRTDVLAFHPDGRIFFNPNNTTWQEINDATQRTTHLAYLKAQIDAIKQAAKAEAQALFTAIEARTRVGGNLEATPFITLQNDAAAGTNTYIVQNDDNNTNNVVSLVRDAAGDFIARDHTGNQINLFAAKTTIEAQLPKFLKVKQDAILRYSDLGGVAAAAGAAPAVVRYETAGNNYDGTILAGTISPQGVITIDGVATALLYNTYQYVVTTIPETIRCKALFARIAALPIATAAFHTYDNVNLGAGNLANSRVTITEKGILIARDSAGTIIPNPYQHYAAIETVVNANITAIETIQRKITPFFDNLRPRPDAAATYYEAQHFGNNINYRVYRDGKIEFSRDNGATWAFFDRSNYLQFGNDVIVQLDAQNRYKNLFTLIDTLPIRSATSHVYENVDLGGGLGRRQVTLNNEGRLQVNPPLAVENPYLIQAIYDHIQNNIRQIEGIVTAHVTRFFNDLRPQLLPAQPFSAKIGDDHFRIYPDGKIEYSTDNGANWTVYSRTQYLNGDTINVGARRLNLPTAQNLITQLRDQNKTRDEAAGEKLAKQIKDQGANILVIDQQMIANASHDLLIKLFTDCRTNGISCYISDNPVPAIRAEYSALGVQGLNKGFNQLNAMRGLEKTNAHGNRIAPSIFLIDRNIDEIVRFNPDRRTGYTLTEDECLKIARELTSLAEKLAATEVKYPSALRKPKQQSEIDSLEYQIKKLAGKRDELRASLLPVKSTFTASNPGNPNVTVITDPNLAELFKPIGTAVPQLDFVTADKISDHLAAKSKIKALHERIILGHPHPEQSAESKPITEEAKLVQISGIACHSTYLMRRPKLNDHFVFKVMIGGRQEEYGIAKISDLPNQTVHAGKKDEYVLYKLNRAAARAAVRGGNPGSAGYPEFEIVTDPSIQETCLTQMNAQIDTSIDYLNNFRALFKGLEELDTDGKNGIKIYQKGLVAKEKWHDVDFDIEGKKGQFPALMIEIDGRPKKHYLLYYPSGIHEIPNPSRRTKNEGTRLYGNEAFTVISDLMLKLGIARVAAPAPARPAAPPPAPPPPAVPVPAPLPPLEPIEYFVDDNRTRKYSLERVTDAKLSSFEVIKEAGSRDRGNISPDARALAKKGVASKAQVTKANEGKATLVIDGEDALRRYLIEHKADKVAKLYAKDKTVQNQNFAKLEFRNIDFRKFYNCRFSNCVFDERCKFPSKADAMDPALNSNYVKYSKAIANLEQEIDVAKKALAAKRYKKDEITDRKALVEMRTRLATMRQDMPETAFESVRGEYYSRCEFKNVRANAQNQDFFRDIIMVPAAAVGNHRTAETTGQHVSRLANPEFRDIGEAKVVAGAGDTKKVEINQKPNPVAGRRSPDLYKVTATRLLDPERERGPE